MTTVPNPMANVAQLRKFRSTLLSLKLEANYHLQVLLLHRVHDQVHLTRRHLLRLRLRLHLHLHLLLCLINALSKQFVAERHLTHLRQKIVADQDEHSNQLIAKSAQITARLLLFRRLLHHLLRRYLKADGERRRKGARENG